MLLETVSEGGREEHTENGMGREIEKVNGMVEPTMWGWGALVKLVVRSVRDRP